MDLKSKKKKLLMDLKSKKKVFTIHLEMTIDGRKHLTRKFRSLCKTNNFHIKLNQSIKATFSPENWRNGSVGEITVYTADET